MCCSKCCTPNFPFWFTISCDMYNNVSIWSATISMSLLRSVDRKQTRSACDVLNAWTEDGWGGGENNAGDKNTCIPDANLRQTQNMNNPQRIQLHKVNPTPIVQKLQPRSQPRNFPIPRVQGPLPVPSPDQWQNSQEPLWATTAFLVKRRVMRYHSWKWFPAYQVDLVTFLDLSSSDTNRLDLRWQDPPKRQTRSCTAVVKVSIKIVKFGQISKHPLRN